MMSPAIILEFSNLLSQQQMLEKNLAHLPVGTLSRKTIHGKTYYYLQRRVHTKVESKYIAADQIEETAAALAERKEKEKQLNTISIRISEIEKAARTMDRPLARRLQLLRLASGMDELSVDEKQNSIVFAQAINAMDGAPASKHTTKLLEEWKAGKRTYLSVLEQTMAYYQV